MVAYHTVKEVIKSDYAGEYETFGICVSTGDGMGDAYISDVFLSQQKINSFVERLNRLKLSGVHLRDVIDDALLDD